MSTDILVSIVIPHYNHARELPDAVRSALAQTWPALEVIVVDDGSDAANLPVLETFNDARVKVIRNAHQGVSVARNTGITEASGKYIVTIDADDRLDPAFVEKALPFLEQDPRLGIVTCRRRYFGSSDRELTHRDMTPENVLLGKAHSGGLGMFRKSDWALTGGYDPALSLYEEWEFWLQIMSLGRVFHRIEEVLYYYREHPNSTMSRFHQSGGGIVNYAKFDPRLYIFKKHAALYMQYPELLVSRIFDQPQRPKSINFRKRKYRFVLWLHGLPLLRRLVAGRVARAREKLEYLNNF